MNKFPLPFLKVYNYTTFGIQPTLITANRAASAIKADIDNYMIIDAGVASAILGWKFMSCCHCQTLCQQAC